MRRSVFGVGESFGGGGGGVGVAGGSSSGGGSLTGVAYFGEGVGSRRGLRRLGVAIFTGNFFGVSTFSGSFLGVYYFGLSWAITSTISRPQ